jgi:hypothetical protein
MARLESQPVIEQAKGVLIAQTGCGPDEAFKMLRSASQRMNVRVRDLAADIVARASSAAPAASPPAATRSRPAQRGRSAHGRPSPP